MEPASWMNDGFFY